LLNSRSKSEIVLTNFSLPSRCDLGPFRTRTLGSEWSFKKLVNLELGLAAPAFVHLHDLEYLGNRLGALCFDNPQGYFESKQPGSPIFLVRLAQELSHLILSLRKPSKKVLVLDLDNTLWGGVIGDDGLEGIELGDTSPRAEAFKSFQKYIKTLASRGILLAVCSKNNEDIALQPFDHHPEMVLSRKDIASFKANWLPKSENLKQIATELNLGLDSLVFVDDNPAEIDLVRQFLPQVEAVLLGPDPADYIAQLKNRRLFEVNHLTSEDAQRSQSYQAERSRIELRNVAPDLPSYWASLEMRASFQPFSKVDAPRIAQLINKSNQFNTTTKRRSEAEVAALIDCDRYVTIATRLADRFGDHGLIGVIIGLIQDDRLEIDTWLMSCRVLQRQVEHESLNKLVRLAQCRGCRQILAQYIRTPKNNLVSNLFPSLGFTALSASEFMLDVDAYVPHSTHIRS
jgi:FkbH-like protein